MDQTKALHQLSEAADLLSMIDTLVAAGNDNLSASSWAGLRITLRNVKGMVLGSHDTLAADYLNRARVATKPEQAQAAAAAPAPNGNSALASDPNGVKMQRRDLRASLEKFVERSNG